MARGSMCAGGVPVICVGTFARAHVGVQGLLGVEGFTPAPVAV
jgi:hypothetical protein